MNGADIEDEITAESVISHTAIKTSEQKQHESHCQEVFPIRETLSLIIDFTTVG